jgi:hypothetical protein
MPPVELQRRNPLPYCTVQYSTKCIFPGQVLHFHCCLVMSLHSFAWLINFNLVGSKLLKNDSFKGRQQQEICNIFLPVNCLCPDDFDFSVPFYAVLLIKDGGHQHEIMPDNPFNPFSHCLFVSLVSQPYVI